MRERGTENYKFWPNSKGEFVVFYDIGIFPMEIDI